MLVACATQAHAGFFGWLSTPKDNETESDARMTGDAATLAMLDQREAVLSVGLRIARARAYRDSARAAGDRVTSGWRRC